ncbi:MAG: SDR family oxidoreductase [Pseudomonadota bacterium]
MALYEGFDFSNKTVWITGASSGIGEALAKKTAERGSTLILSARNVEELNRVAKLCQSAGASTSNVVPLDVSDHDSLKPLADSVIEEFGAIDLLVNNAGISQRSFCKDTSFTVYQQMMDINVLGQIALTLAVLPSMLERGSGHLAVTSSVAGKIGAPQRTGYCAAKHAVMGFFDALRSEVTVDGLQVTTITPGFIRTNVSSNALSGDGSKTGFTDENIAEGMDVDECAQVIIDGFENGIPEITVGGREVGMLDLKRSDPEAVFNLADQMARRLRGLT